MGQREGPPPPDRRFGHGVDRLRELAADLEKLDHTSPPEQCLKVYSALQQSVGVILAELRAASWPQKMP